jgi:hypothetical protein
MDDSTHVKENPKRHVPGNHHPSTRHGGEAAVKSLAAGEPLRGLAAQAQQAVENELEVKGVSSIVRTNATRMQAAADLYWGAIQKAAETGRIDDLDRYIQRFGWLSGAALRAWQAVEVAEKNAGKGVSIVDVLQSIRGDTDANSK